MIDHSASFVSAVHENWHRWAQHTWCEMQLFTLTHLFWLPLVFQGHQMYLPLAVDNFSSLYLIIQRDFAHSLLMLIVFSGLLVGKKQGRSISAGCKNGASSTAAITNQCHLLPDVSVICSAQCFASLQRVLPKVSFCWYCCTWVDLNLVKFNSVAWYLNIYWAVES